MKKINKILSLSLCVLYAASVCAMDSKGTGENNLRVEDCPCPTCLIFYTGKIISYLDSLEIPVLRKQSKFNISDIYEARNEVLRISKKVKSDEENKDLLKGYHKSIKDILAKYEFLKTFKLFN